ncbi:hypothetical protein FCI23_39165 [Actinacidiphila oryziradicis]|uniref:Ricin B lectin domain-containing protein n=2 Tax=Actinacidiphila oryziradicis TaxID=2571141 RepID=A0A4U0S020_9ACTN|nr:hypothetical protein FCI23_39165 [Actinacidiphila oryziradicis]
METGGERPVGTGGTQGNSGGAVRARGKAGASVRARSFPPGANRRCGGFAPCRIRHCEGNTSAPGGNSVWSDRWRHFGAAGSRARSTHLSQEAAMGEPEQTNSGGPGVHGFARSFAATLRQPGEQDKPNVVSRMVVICVTVAVIIGGAVGVGMLLSYQRQQNNKKASASTVALQTHASPSSTGATSAKPGATKHSSTPSPVQKAAGAVSAGSQGKSTSQLTTSQTGAGTTTTGSGSGSPTTGSGSSGSGSTSSGSGSTTPKSTSTAAPLPARSIISYASSRCIDVTNGSTTPGTQLQIWDCNGYNWQQWSFPSDGTVRSMGMCLAVAGGSTANGAAIQLAKCNGSSAQKFTLNSSYDLVNANANKCVDVKDQQTANGTPLQLWSCEGASNQKWHLG